MVCLGSGVGQTLLTFASDQKHSAQESADQRATHLGSHDAPPTLHVIVAGAVDCRRMAPAGHLQDQGGFFLPVKGVVAACFGVCFLEGLARLAQGW